MNNMNSSQKVILFLCIVVAGLIALYEYKKYRVAPTIDLFKQELYNENNEAVYFELYKGKKLIVCYYASWCGECLKEMEMLNKIKTTALNDVDVIAITDEEVDKLIRFKNKKNYPFTFLRMKDPFSKINIYTIPVTYIISRKGELVYEKTGAINWKDASFVAHVKSLM